MITLTQGADGSRSMSFDPMPMVAMFMGQPLQPLPAAPPPPASPVTPAPTAQEPKAARQSVAPKASRKAKAQHQPKAAKGDGKAKYAQIRSLVSSGDIDGAIALAASFGWQDMAERLTSKRGEAQQATQRITQTAAKGRKASRDDVAKTEAALLAQEPKATQEERKTTTPKPSAPKGRPAKDRCSTHNLFRKADGTCSRCEGEGVQPSQEEPKAPAGKAPKVTSKGRKAKPEPKAPTAKVTKVTSTQDVLALGQSIPLEPFPAALSEGDLAMHWGLLKEQGHKDILVAALDASRSALMDTARPKDERGIWAKRSQTLQNILGLRK